MAGRLRMMSHSPVDINPTPPIPPATSNIIVPGTQEYGAWAPWTYETMPAAFSQYGTGSEYGYTQYARNQWFTVPDQAIGPGETITIEWLADSNSCTTANPIGIQYSAISCNGGPLTIIDAPTLCTDGCMMFRAVLRCNDIPAGADRRVELRMFSVPIAGYPRVMQQTFVGGVATGPIIDVACGMTVWANKSGAARPTRYFSLSGSDTTGNGLTPATAYATPGKCFLDIQTANGNVNMALALAAEAGSYTLSGSTAAKSNSTWCEIDAMPGLDPATVIFTGSDGSSGVSVNRLKISNIKVTGQIWNLASRKGYLWLAALAEKSGSNTSGSSWTAGGVWRTDCPKLNTAQPAGVMARNCIVRDTTADCFSNNHAVAQCQLISARIAVPSTNHTDAYQFLSNPVSATGHDNYIIYRLVGTENNNVQFIFCKDSAAKNISFRECTYYGVGQTLIPVQLSQVVTNWLIQDCDIEPSHVFRFDIACTMTDVRVFDSPAMAFSTWSWTYEDVTGVTQANPAVVTHYRHNLETGWTIRYSGIDGMTPLNGVNFKVIVIDASTYSLTTEAGVPIDSTGYPAFINDSSGNSITLVSPNPRTGFSGLSFGS